MKRFLSQHGFPATIFASGEALLQHDDFSKVLCFVMDINVRGDSGIELYRKLADGGMKSPVIFITGNDSEANRRASTEPGCIGYLIKPFVGKSLMALLEKIPVQG